METHEKELLVQLRLKELEKPVSHSLDVKPASEANLTHQQTDSFCLPFQEKEVDKCFLHWENSYKFRMSERCMDIASLIVLLGKAHGIYSLMSVEECSQYDHVKKWKHMNWYLRLIDKLFKGAKAGYTNHRL